MTSQTGSNISSKCNQTVKFGQLIEYNIKILFLEENAVAKLAPDPFIKKQN